MKNSKLKFSEYVQNVSRSKSFGTFVLIVQMKVSSGPTQQICSFIEFVCYKIVCKRKMSFHGLMNKSR